MSSKSKSTKSVPVGKRLLKRKETPPDSPVRNEDDNAVHSAPVEEEHVNAKKRRHDVPSPSDFKEDSVDVDAMQEFIRREQEEDKPEEISNDEEAALPAKKSRTEKIDRVDSNAKTLEIPEQQKDTENGESEETIKSQIEALQKRLQVKNNTSSSSPSPSKAISPAPAVKGDINDILKFRLAIRKHNMYMPPIRNKETGESYVKMSVKAKNGRTNFYVGYKGKQNFTPYVRQEVTYSLCTFTPFAILGSSDRDNCFYPKGTIGTSIHKADKTPLFTTTLTDEPVPNSGQTFNESFAEFVKWWDEVRDEVKKLCIANISSFKKSIQEAYEKGEDIFYASKVHLPTGELQFPSEHKMFRYLGEKDIEKKFPKSLANVKQGLMDARELENIKSIYGDEDVTNGLKYICRSSLEKFHLNKQKWVPTQGKPMEEHFIPLFRPATPMEQSQRKDDFLELGYPEMISTLRHRDIISDGIKVIVSEGPDGIAIKPEPFAKIWLCHTDSIKVVHVATQDEQPKTLSEDTVSFIQMPDAPKPPVIPTQASLEYKPDTNVESID